VDKNKNIEMSTTEDNDSRRQSEFPQDCSGTQRDKTMKTVTNRFSPSDGEKLYNVISRWEQEKTGGEFRIGGSMACNLSKREQIVHSTPWMKEFILEILPYPGFREEILGRIRLWAQICAHPLREV